jgi:hypothetical protein
MRSRKIKNYKLLTFGRSFRQSETVCNGPFYFLLGLLVFCKKIHYRLLKNWAEVERHEILGFRLHSRRNRTTHEVISICEFSQIFVYVNESHHRMYSSLYPAHANE